jgi:hypothetical protein
MQQLFTKGWRVVMLGRAWLPACQQENLYMLLLDWAAGLLSAVVAGEVRSLRRSDRTGSVWGAATMVWLITNSR